jgi:hypothetical protein
MARTGKTSVRAAAYADQASDEGRDEQVGSIRDGNPRRFEMMVKIAIAFTAALSLGVASMALAANESDTPGGYRELGPGGAATSGINPAYHSAAAAKCAKQHKASYDPSDMTFLGKDGKRHPCPG